MQGAWRGGRTGQNEKDPEGEIELERNRGKKKDTEILSTEQKHTVQEMRQKRKMETEIERKADRIDFSLLSKTGGDS